MAQTDTNRRDLHAQVVRLLALSKRNPLLLVVLVGGVLLALSLRGGEPEREILLSGQRFRAEELAAIEAAFARGGLQDYQIRDEVVWVPRSQKTAYLRALADAEVLPQAMSAPLQEAILSSHPFESPAQRQARWKFAGEQELASHLRALDDIDDATVRFDEGQHDGLQPSQAVRAVVVLKPAPGAVLVPERLEAVCDLVAASRVGMTAGDVTVLDLGSGKTYTSGVAWTAAQRAEQFAYRKLTYESHWDKKVAELLGFIPRVSVATKVQLSEESLCPCGIHVVVTVPETYYRAVWHDQCCRARHAVSEPAADEWRELHQQVESHLREIIEQLFPAHEADQPAATIAVAAVPDLPGSATPMSSESNRRPSARIAVTLLFIVACALALAGFVRDCLLSSAAALPGPSAAAHSMPPGTDRTLASTADVPTRSESVSAEREELVRLVRSNPAAAAATLRSWVKPTS